MVYVVQFNEERQHFIIISPTNVSLTAVPQVTNVSQTLLSAQLFH